METEKSKVTDKEVKGEGQDGGVKEEDIIPVAKEAVIGKWNVNVYVFLFFYSIFAGSVSDR